MTRDFIQPRDEAGSPRHFRSHREALTRIAGSLAGQGPKFLLNFVWMALLWLAWRAWRALFHGEPLDLLPPEPGLAVVVPVAILLALWVLSTILLYGYVALSGGVMGRAERDQAGRPPRG